MRLATWNCQHGLGPNWDAIEELDVDVLAIQEARADTKDLMERHKGWKCVWREGRYYPGIAVLVRHPFTTADESEPSEPFVISTLITGPEHFRFVDFWAMTPGNVGGLSYTGQARRMIEQLPDDDVPTVVAGDFNHSKDPYHLENVERLRARGLVSAYHDHNHLGPLDDEVEKTRFARGPDGPAWHIDLIFVPRDWSIQGVEVGAFKQYAGPGRSDHVPVVVTIGSTTKQIAETERVD